MHLQISDSKDRRRLSFAAPNHCLRPCQKFSQIKWFRDVVVRACIQQRYNGFTLVACGQNQHRSSFFLRAKFFYDFQSADARQHQVQNYQIVFDGARHKQSFLAVGRKIVEVAEPLWLRIGGYWYPRGGIPIDVFYQTAAPPDGLWIPDPDVVPYRGRG